MKSARFGAVFNVTLVKYKVLFVDCCSISSWTLTSDMCKLIFVCDVIEVL